MNNKINYVINDVKSINAYKLYLFFKKMYICKYITPKNNQNSPKNIINTKISP